MEIRLEVRMEVRMEAHLIIALLLRRHHQLPFKRSAHIAMVREKRSSMSQSQLLGWMVLRPIVQNVISLGAMGRYMHIIPAVIAMVRATIHTNLCHLP